MADSITDPDLLRDFSERGSESAFQTLVERHVNLVFGTAMRGLKNESIAHEVSQNVFVTLSRKAGTLHHHNSLAGWLHKTTLLETRQWWRGELRRQHREHTAAELGTTMKEDDSLLEALSEVLDEGLLKLQDADREVLLLRFFGEKSHREIGDALGTKEDAARKRIDRALEKLTEFFRQRGYVVPTVAVSAAALQASAQAAPVGLAASIFTTAVVSGVALNGTATMAMTALQKGLVMATLIGVGVTSLFMEQRVEARLREEVSSLRQQSAQLTLLQAENERIATQLEQARSRQPNHELLTLRGLVGVLRRETNELKQLADDIRTFKPVPTSEQAKRIAEGYLPRETWAYVGFETPDDAYQSSAWAVEHHDTKAFLECLAPKFHEQFKDTATVQGLNGIVSAECKEYKVVRKETPSEDEVVLHISSEDYYGHGKIVPHFLKRIDGKWKLARALGSEK